MNILKGIKWQFYILSLQFLFVMLLILNLKISFPKLEIFEDFNKMIQYLKTEKYINIVLILVLIIWYIKEEYKIKYFIVTILGSIIILIFSIKIQEFKTVVLCIIMLLIGKFSEFYLNRNRILAKKLPVEVLNIKEENLDPSSFIATYIVPMIAFQYNELQNFMVLILYLIIVGKIYIGTNLYYTNPTLSLLGYKIYIVETKKIKKIILITKEKIIKDDIITMRELDKGIFLGRKK